MFYVEFYSMYKTKTNANEVNFVQKIAQKEQ